MSSGIVGQRLLTSFRLIRIGFLPVLLISNVSMLIGIRALVPDAHFNSITFVVVAANIAWMLYGSLLNDYYDAPMDRHNRAARKVLSDPSVSTVKKRSVVLVGAAVVVAFDTTIAAVLSGSDVRRLLPFMCVTAIGAFSATAYSMPPVRARKRLFGASWTLMIYHPFCLARLLIVAADPTDIFGEMSRPKFIFAAAFLWLIHGITTISMKDIPDVFADVQGGVRSVPAVFGPTGSTISAAVIILAVLASTAYGVASGYLSASIYVVVIPVAVLFVVLSAYLHLWFLGATRETRPRDARTPRTLYHAVAYPLSWAVLIPGLMWCLR